MHVGAGIFGLPAKTFRLSGVYSLLALGICALVVFVIILCFAEVSSRFDKTGGPYIYILAAFGRFPAFLMGWLLEIARIVTFAALLNLLITYLSIFSPVLESKTPMIITMVVLIGVLTIINHIGVKNSTRLNNILTVSKLLPLFTFIVIGIFHLQPALLTSAKPPDSAGISSAVLLWIFAFGGFESVVVNSGEMKDPKKTLPFALIASTILIALIYFLVQLVTIGTLPSLANSERPLADAASVILGGWGAYLIGMGAVISITGTLNAIMLIGSRVPFALSSEGQFPRMFAFIHPKYKTPTWSLLLFSVLTLIVSLQGSFMNTLTISVIVRVLIYLFVCISMLVMRGRLSNAPFTIHYGYVVATMAILFSCWLLTTSQTTELRDVSICMLGGVVFYLIFNWKK